MSEWNSIETVPLTNERIILTDGENVVLGNFHRIDCNTVTYTHWMPLPEIPKKKHACFPKPLHTTGIRCVSLSDSKDWLNLFWVDGSSLLVKFCPFCGGQP